MVRGVVAGLARHPTQRVTVVCRTEAQMIHVCAEAAIRLPPYQGPLRVNEHDPENEEPRASKGTMHRRKIEATVRRRYEVDREARRADRSVELRRYEASREQHLKERLEWLQARRPTKQPTIPNK